MQLQQTQKAPSLPFALQNHEAAYVKNEETLLGNPEQEWTWQPVGDFQPKDLAIYASGGNSTTRQTGQGQWDSGELY